MSELRKDPVVGRWVIISPERGKRPSDYATRKTAKKEGFCPLCPGNESLTPPEIFAFREKGTRPDGPGWSIRVVPNKFPALMRGGRLERRKDGVFNWMNGVGEHEVVVETPEHAEELTDLPLESVKKILFVFKMRMEELAKDPRFRYVVVFKNRGQEAGASLQHSHSQIIALPIVPKRVIEELKGGKRYHDEHGRCIYCEMLAQEGTRGIRVIEENDNFIAFAPFAARCLCVGQAGLSGEQFADGVASQQFTQDGIVVGFPAEASGHNCRRDAQLAGQVLDSFFAGEVWFFLPPDLCGDEQVGSQGVGFNFLRVVHGRGAVLGFVEKGHVVVS